MSINTGASTPAPPPTSPDGRFWWNGREWVPFAAPTEPVRTNPTDTATGVAGGIGKFILGLLLIPLGLAVFGLIGMGISMGSVGPTIVPLLLVGGVGVWYYKRLR